MSHTALRQALVCVLLLPATGRADEGNELVRALEVRVERAVREAKPAVACILVSRSEDYHKAPFWGTPPDPDQPGQLGRFDASKARTLVPTDARNRSRALRTIAQHDLSDPDAVPESYGSGFVVDRSGLVLTNAHVVKNATKVYVRLPGKRGSWADVHACDPRSDLAVLKLLDPPADLKALPLGEGGFVRTGKFVLSIANPFAPGFKGGDEPTASYGLVSNVRQRLPGNPDEMELSKVTLHHYGTLIQTDARTTPGCSGGALLDLDGKVLGLTTALAAIRGERPGGFAIPFDGNTRRIIEVLKRGEEVEYGFLGVVLHRNGPFGGGGPVRLWRVSPGSPAHRAGLAANQVIVSINGNPIRENSDLFLYVGMALAGNTARVQVSRGPGAPAQTHEVKLAKFYVPGPVIASKRPPARFGLRVDHTSVLAQRNPFPHWGRGPADGVIVREVVSNSPADDARLQPDKVITHVDGRAVASPAEYYREVARAGKKVELTIHTSDGRPESISLEEK